MFTGIVEETGKVRDIKKYEENVDLTIQCRFTKELDVDQSVAINGVCLTVVGRDDDTFTVTAMKETLLKSNIGDLSVGDPVNLERGMMMNARLDGHIVQGHVDTTAICVDRRNAQGSYYFRFRWIRSNDSVRQGYLVVDKGSVTINGVSLTVCDPNDNEFEVAIIPYTFEHTNFGTLKVGDKVNLEFDIIGKYIARLMPS